MTRLPAPVGQSRHRTSGGEAANKRTDVSRTELIIIELHFAAGKYFHCKKFHVRVKHLPEPSRSFDAFPAKTKATCRHSDCVPIIHNC